MTSLNSTSTESQTVAKRPRRMAREPQESTTQTDAKSDHSKPGDGAVARPKRETKAELVLSLLQREEGATIDQLVAATGWLPHTTRAALTGLKKKGHAITSEKPAGGDRTYRVSATSEATQ